MHAPGWRAAALLLACAVAQPVGATTTPDATELFDLETLSYTHFHRGRCGARATVQDAKGYSYPVSIGNRLGRNYGLVVEITEERIRVKELLKGANEEWFERESTLDRVKLPSSGATVKRDPLEQFDLQAMEYWITGRGYKCEIAARIIHGGHVYSVAIGSRMGRNSGVVTRISKNHIVIRERYQKPDGTWFEKEVTMKAPRY